MAFLITLCAIINSCWAFLQRLIYDRRIAATEITQPPIFIIGHWRSGTTYLHELMVRDERFAYPTYYECFEPNHFLVTGWFAPTLLWPLLPGKRPMDNMPTGWHRPQEDEFALVDDGRPHALLPHGLSQRPAAVQRIPGHGRLPAGRPRSLAARHQVLRPSPHNEKRQAADHEIAAAHRPHRRTLAPLPGAKFIHIVRDPYTIFPSTRRLWVSLDWPQGLQHPHDRNLDEYVFASFERMYRGFNRQREKIVPSQLCEIRYEDLVRDPVGQVRTIYEKLELGDFEHVRPQLEAYAGQQKDYQVNRHDLEPELRSEIRRRWSDYFIRYGYE